MLQLKERSSLYSSCRLFPFRAAKVLAGPDPTRVFLNPVAKRVELFSQEPTLSGAFLPKTLDLCSEPLDPVILKTWNDVRLSASQTVAGLVVRAKQQGPASTLRAYNVASSGPVSERL